MTSHPQQDVCCLMGEPIAGNPTQYMLEAAFAVGRIDWRFLSFEVPAIDFEGALRGARIFGFQGIMLAPPHCATALPYLEELSAVARLSGQVNCIRSQDGKFVGDNTQGKSLRSFAEQSIDLAGAQVTIIGSGRLARVYAAELATSGVKDILLVSRSSEQLESLTHALVEQTSLESCRNEALDAEQPIKVGEDCRLLVNATPLGRHDAPTEAPVDVESIPADALVADVVYNPPQTQLIRESKALGCATIDGLSLLIEKTALAFETWTGASADRQAMREAVEEFLVL